MKLLLTGFEPWNSHINPSWEAVKLTPDRVEGIKIEKLMLPVSAQRAVPLLKERMRAIVPDAVICTGQDGRKQAITIERIAINLDDYRVPDNDGIIIKDKKIVDDGPDAYFSTLPVRRMLDAIMARGVPAVLSYTAGTHLCNHVMYSALPLAANGLPGTTAGFIHVPLDVSQCQDATRGGCFMDIESTVKGLVAAIGALY